MLGAHVADGRLTRATDGLGSLAEILDNMAGAAANSENRHQL